MMQLIHHNAEALKRCLTAQHAAKVLRSVNGSGSGRQQWHPTPRSHALPTALVHEAHQTRLNLGNAGTSSVKDSNISMSQVPQTISSVFANDQIETVHSTA
jgi:hypothetical protein